MRKVLAPVVTLLLVLGLAMLLPGVAHAHDVLEATSPADGTTVAALPDSVELTFSDTPLAIGSQVVVRGPSGDVADGTPTIDGRVVTQRIVAAAPAGDYTVTYRVTSSDGHPISGTFGFHATVGLDGSTATAGPTVHAPAKVSPEAAAAKQSQFVPVMLTIVGVLVLIGIAVVVWLFVRRRGAHT